MESTYLGTYLSRWKVKIVQIRMGGRFRACSLGYPGDLVALVHNNISFTITYVHMQQISTH